MEINWPEVLISGLIFFVVGAVFQIYLQPRIEKRLASRRESRQLKLERENALLAAEIARLAANPELFAARFREEVLRILGLLVTAVVTTLAGLALGSAGVPYVAFVPFAFALWLVIPAASACAALLAVTRGVRTSLEESDGDAHLDVGDQAPV